MIARLASMLARVASGRSPFPLPVPAAAALSRAAHSGDLILGSDASKRQLFGCAQAQHTRRSFSAHSSSAGEKNLYTAFFFEEKDMESDEALWALYHGWCKHHKVQRDHDDMISRFDEFKNCVHRANNLGELSLNAYSDTRLEEMCSSTPMLSDEAYERFKALGGFTIEFGPPDD